MTQTVDFYCNAIRKQSDNASKLRAALHAYAWPRGCFFIRTFKADIVRVLRNDESSFADMLNALNKEFASGRDKARIKPNCDFYNCMMAIVTELEGITITFRGEGHLLTCVTASAGDEVSAVVGDSFHLARLGSIDDQRIFCQTFDDLYSLVRTPDVTLDDIQKFKELCARKALKNPRFTFANLLKFKDVKTGNTLLHACVHMISSDGCISVNKIVSDFVTGGAIVDATNNIGRTALLEAAIIGNTAVANHLYYNCGADTGVESTSADGCRKVEDYMTFRARDALLLAGAAVADPAIEAVATRG